MDSIKRLWPYLKPYRWHLIGSFILAFPLAALRVGPAPLANHFINQLQSNPTTETVYRFPLYVIGLYLANFIFRFGHYYLIRVVVAKTNENLKQSIFDHLLTLSPDYFNSQRTGALISRTAVDPQFVDGGISSLNVIIREPITLLFTLGYALYLNWRLVILTFFVIPPLFLVFRATSRNLKRYILRMTEENALLVSTLQESYSGIRMVKLFNLEKYVQARFKQQNSNFTRFLLKTAILEETSHPLVELVTAFAIAALFFYGGKSVLKHHMSTGDLFAFFIAFGMSLNPIRLLNEVNVKWSQAQTALDRIWEVFQWKTNISEVNQPRSLHKLEKQIELENVSFSYPDAPERKILNNISATIHKGEVVAFVGGSGAGKTSLVNLIPRLYDVTQGSIKIDGVDVRSLSLKSLRDSVAVVSQDIFLFNDTVLENIRCGSLDATEAEIVEAAKQAHAWEFIQKLSHGILTKIGDRGQKLSGGEKQRISIARAFLKKSPILILDEATSSLDTQSEKLVQAAINDLVKNRTTIVVAHRLVTIQNADRIFVMREGQIVEQGKHTDLLEKRGEYEALYRAYL